MALDRYGLVVSTASAAARDAYVEAVDCLLSANAGAEGAFDRAIAADPAFALAHIGRARSLQLQARVAEGRDAAGRARALVARGTARERGQVEALATPGGGGAVRARGGGGARRGGGGRWGRSPWGWRGMQCAPSPRLPTTSSRPRATRWC